MNWIQLAFTVDDVVGGWQDSRLAESFVHAWERAGRPDDFLVRQAAGGSGYVESWWVSPSAARVLDAAGVSWRRFIVGEGRPPAHAVDALRLQ
jgi:hypothetical protein